MKKIKEAVKKEYGNYPERILQFGEGNFLRAFADWMVEEANESGEYKGSIVVCQPIDSESIVADYINEQDGMYTLVMRGLENGEALEKAKVITSVSRCISAYKDFEELVKIAESSQLEVVISNTTEAGIVYKAGDKLEDTPPSSFPAKVCVLLYRRYKAFNGDNKKGLLFLPVELIDYNGDELKRIVLKYAEEWGLEKEFIEWVNTANKFTNTLVDRIVTGYPRDQVEYFDEKLNYKDNIIVTSELFNLWVIEGKKEWADILPIHNGSPNVIWTEDVKPYKMRKVRILNGGHTSMVLAAYLAGFDTVLGVMEQPMFVSYLRKLLFEEVIPTIDLPEEELSEFAESVIDRFSNPYIRHQLLDIALNSCSKFNTRCLPSLLFYYEKYKKLPKLLTFSFAAFIKFYQGKLIDGNYTGSRSDQDNYLIRDDEEVIRFFHELSQSGDLLEITNKVLSNQSFWGGKDLTEISGLADQVKENLERLNTMPVMEVIKGLVE